MKKVIEKQKAKKVIMKRPVGCIPIVEQGCTHEAFEVCALCAGKPTDAPKYAPEHMHVRSCLTTKKQTHKHKHKRSEPMGEAE